MTFSKEVLDKFEEIWRGRKTLTISGVNGVGQEFTTCGRITTTDQGEIGCHDNHVYLEFGTSKDSPTRKQTAYFAPFSTEIDKNLSFCELILYALEISDENGNLIFSNEDKDLILKTTERNAKRVNAENKKEGRDILEKDMDPVTKKLMEMVGKPIILDGKEGVLIGMVRGAANQGSTIVNYYSGPIVGSMFVDFYSKLETEDLNGKIEKVEENNPFETIKIFRHRAKRIADASSSQDM